MFFIHPNVFTLTTFGGHPRLPIALLLFITGILEIRRTFDRLFYARIAVPVLLWFFYTVFSTVVVYEVNQYNIVYEQIGDFLVFLLVASYVSTSKYKELVLILLSIALALTINLIAFLPKVSSLFSFIPMYGYYHHGGAGLSGFKLIPILLFMYNRNHIKTTKAAYLALILFASLMTFLSGSRTAMIGTICVLILYKRSIKWLTILVLMGLIAYYLSINYTDPTWGAERVERVYLAFAEGRPTSIEEVDFRISHLEIGFNALREQPILGYGFGSWDYVRGQAYGILDSKLGAHSSYALIMSETGILGMILFSMMIYFCIRNTAFMASNNYQKDLQYNISLLILACLLLGINSTIFWNRQFTIFLGIAAGAKLRLKYNTR